MMNPPRTQFPAGDMQPLSAALKDARSQLATRYPPAYVQSTVLAALPPARAKGTLASWFEERVLQWVVTGGQVRTARIAGLAVVFGLLAAGAALIAWRAAHFGARAVTQQVATAFIPLVSAERMGAQNLGWVVATDVPRANLATLGLPYDPARAGDTVRAEMLMNSAGEVLAVRFVQ
jgi:hypothetical protein